MKKANKYSRISALLAALLAALLLMTACTPELPPLNDGTTGSSDTTVTPSDTTADPSDTTATPSGTTETPSGTTATPSGTTETPSGTTATPSGTTETPSGTTATPSGTPDTPQGGDVTTGDNSGSGTTQTPNVGDGFQRPDDFDGGSPTNKPSSGLWWSDYTAYTVAQNLNKFHIQGRTRELSVGMTADWAASGFEFLADFEGSVYVVASASAKCDFAVFLNGVQVGVLSLSAGENLQYELPISTSGNGQVIRLVRMTRPKDAQASFAKVLVNGEVKNWAQTSRKLIEFVGDSITCGCGLVDPSLADYDASKTYAYKLATSLGCDYSMIAEGGIGVSASTDWHNGNTSGTIYGTAGYYRDPAVTYTATRKADLIVVNLNTNDNGRATNATEYKNDARALINQIRAMHGQNVKIVWVVGHMINSTADVNVWLSEVIAEFSGIYTLTVEKNTSGGGSHPSQSSHNAVALALENFINTNNLLG